MPSGLVAPPDQGTFFQPRARSRFAPTPKPVDDVESGRGGGVTTEPSTSDWEELGTSTTATATAASGENRGGGETTPGEK